MLISDYRCKMTDQVNKQRTENPDTLHFFADTRNECFFTLSAQTSKSILRLERDLWEFDRVFDSFSDLGKHQLLQSFLIREIQATGAIEGIQSTLDDILYLLKSKKKIKNKKIISVTNAYSILLDQTVKVPENLQDIRDLYDRLMKEAARKKDLPYGEYFRKGYVYINNGLKTVHRGFYPEQAVNRGMSEFLNLYNDSSKEIFERMILTHYMIEAVHPFYDGNGRLGRFLFTLGLYAKTGSYLSFSVASAFNQKRSAYYKAFNEAQHEHMSGSLNSYFEDISFILHSYFESLNKELQEKKRQIDSFTVSSSEFTKSEQKILKMLAEAALLSEFGITNNEIIEHGDLSKRTVISAIQKFREMDLFDETKIGRFEYHRLKSEQIGRL